MSAIANDVEMKYLSKQELENVLGNKNETVKQLQMRMNLFRSEKEETEKEIVALEAEIKKLEQEKENFKRELDQLESKIKRLQVDKDHILQEIENETRKSAFRRGKI